LNIVFERLRLAAIAGDQEVYDAILRHLRSLKAPRLDEHDET
jgi:hypothetical protein